MCGCIRVRSPAWEKIHSQRLHGSVPVKTFVPDLNPVPEIQTQLTMRATYTRREAVKRMQIHCVTIPEKNIKKNKKQSTANIMKDYNFNEVVTRKVSSEQMVSICLIFLSSQSVNPHQAKHT